jgi:short-subunit dehydrogenase
VDSALPPSPIWITGTRSGIGNALANAYREQGATVIGSSRQRQSESDPRSTSPLDLADPVSVSAYQDALAEADPGVLILNAGEAIWGELAAKESKSIDREVDVLLRANVHLFAAALSRMQERGVGTIALIGSLADRYPLPGPPLYSAAKAALSALASAVRNDLARQASPVRVFDFRLGDVRTDFNRNLWQQSASPSPTETVLRERLDRDLARRLPPGTAAQRIIHRLKESPPGSYVIATRRQHLLTAIGDQLPPGWRERLTRSYFAASA